MRRAWLEEKVREAQSLGDVQVQNLVPSRRDFHHFTATHKDGVAVVVRLKRRDPGTGGEWPDVDLTALAQAADDADVGAIAVRSTALFSVDREEMARCAAAVTAPVLCDDLCLDARLIYQARLHGADAVVIPGDLDPGDLAELTDITTSLHMVAVVEVRNHAELTAALACSHTAIGINCVGGDGFIDVGATQSLALATPRQRLVLTLAEVRDLDEVERLSGSIDSAVIGDLFLAAGDPGSAIRSAVESLG